MSQILLVRTAEPLPDEAAAVNRFLFQCYEGLTHEHTKSWRRLWARLKGFAGGEIAEITSRLPRNPGHHRKFFALLNVAFNAWQPDALALTYNGKPVQKDFEAFREELTILAGFYDATYSPRGDVRLKAKSISFAAMNQATFERLYDAVADVILQHVLVSYSGREELDAVVARVMSFGGGRF